MRLGAARWPIAIGAVLVGILAVYLPLVAIVLRAACRTLGQGLVANNLTWRFLIQAVTPDQAANTALLRSLGFAGATALFTGVVALLLALARSLAARPRLILLDEPLSNVDAALREQLRTEILQAVHAQGATAIYITHDQSEAMAMCDRLAVMHDGRILQTGAPEDLYRRPTSLFVANFLGGANLLRGAVTMAPKGPKFVAGPCRMRLAEVRIVGPSETDHHERRERRSWPCEEQGLVGPDLVSDRAPDRLRQ